MNRVVLVGRITHDLDLKYTNSGIPVLNFSLAVNRNYTNEQGERDTDFIRCVVWRAQAENMSKYVGKGSLIGVDGKIQSSTYETQEGEKRTSIEVLVDQVTFLESKGAKEESSYKPPFETDYEDDYPGADEMLKSAIEVDVYEDDDDESHKLPF